MENLTHIYLERNKIEAVAHEMNMNIMNMNIQEVLTKCLTSPVLFQLTEIIFSSFDAVRSLDSLLVRC